MEKLTLYLARLLTRRLGSPKDPAVRAYLGELEGWVSTGLNLVLAALKGVLGVWFQSAGLISDAVHSLGDMATSLVVIVGFRISAKPADLEHPFGHERSEHIATLVIAVLLVIAGFEVGKETLVSLLGNPQHGAERLLTWPLFWVLVGLLLVKELLCRFSEALGRLIESPALMADAWHHRTDALTTGVVIGGLAGRNFGLPWLDAAAGLGVSVFIVVTGVQMAYRSFSPLLGETAPAKDLASIRETACKLPGVVNVHDIRVQRYGNFNITTMHIELSDRLDVHRMHDITVQVETRVLKIFPGECVVHIDPIDYHHPLFDRVSNAIRDAVVAHPGLVDFHDLKLWQQDGQEMGDVEISVEPEVFDRQSGELSDYVLKRVGKNFPALRIAVRLKVDFSATPLEA